jgi:hypothetical protein
MANVPPQQMVMVPVAPRPPLPRHALGLPAGTVRSLLAIAVLALSWLVVLVPAPGQVGPAINEKLPVVFVYLMILGGLIVAHFFAAHGNTIGPHISEGSPLGLPRGSVRFLLVVGYIGLAAFLYHLRPEFTYPPQGDFVLLLLLLFSAFFLGHILTLAFRRAGGGLLPPWFQDFEAWVALLAMLILVILFLVHVFINPSLPAENQFDLPKLNAALAALVGFYFGARS